MRPRIRILTATLVLSIITAALVVVFDATPSRGPVQEEILHSSPPDRAVQRADDETLDAPYVRYESTSETYSLRYPATWHLEDAGNVPGGDRLQSPDGRVIVRISARDTKFDSPQAAWDTLEDSLQTSRAIDPSYTLDYTERTYWKSHSTLVVHGTREVGNAQWRIRSHHVFRPEHGDILTIAAHVRSDVSGLYDRIVKQIFREAEVCDEPRGARLSY